MARNILKPKTNIPEWSVNFFSLLADHTPKTDDRFSELHKKYCKQLRNSASGYISKPAVREYIFQRDGHACKSCGATDNLQVDHIISVANLLDGHISIGMLNHEDNLQTLCRHCNTSKTHLR